MRFKADRRCVVVADDDPGTRNFLGYALDADGFTALPAMDVIQAHDFLLTPGVVAGVFDMLFVNSGGRSGLDLLQFVRTNRKLRELPVIMLTGFDLNRRVLGEVDRLNAELWRKPIDALHLTQHLDQLIQDVDRSSTRTTRFCPTCGQANTNKTAEAAHSELYICFSCHRTFTVTKPPRTSPTASATWFADHR